MSVLFPGQTSVGAIEGQGGNGDAWWPFGPAFYDNWSFNRGWREAQLRVGVRRVEKLDILQLHPSPRSCAEHRRKLTDNKAIN